MTFFPRAFFACVLLVSVLSGCSTPGKRSREHAAAFRVLSSADQHLVFSGRIRPGLSREAVYIAWGEPDQKLTVGDDKDRTVAETWIYRQRITITEPQNSYEYFGPYQGLGNGPSGPWSHPGETAGRFGSEGFLTFQPHVRSMDVLRVAKFGAEPIRAKRATNVRPFRSHSPHGARVPRTAGARSTIKAVCRSSQKSIPRPRLTRKFFHADAGRG